MAAGEFPDFPSCFVENLEERARALIAEQKKTPLILTNGDELWEELLQWFKQVRPFGGPPQVRPASRARRTPPRGHRPLPPPQCAVWARRHPLLLT